MVNYSGKIVAVTGASSGIGKEIAKAFYNSGASIALCSRSVDNLNAAVAEYASIHDPRIFIMKCDTSVVSDIRSFRDAIEPKFGRIDIWVNNAGIERIAPVTELTEEDFNAVVNTNFRGYYFGMQYAAQHMVRRGEGGVIINIGSVNSLNVVEGMSVYAATKAAISHLTSICARELARKGIRVNCIAPGSIPTKINEEKYKDPEVHRAMCEKIPLGRRGEVYEVADATLYLASDKASYITGQTLFVDGGLTLVRG
jgi:NAD(P)-dependent dehydrogenase (short-subunit alcohol dehydrogenase family)